jgi:hypothetical protein
MQSFKTAFWALSGIAFALFAAVMIWTFTSSGYFLRVLDMTYDPQTQMIAMTREVLDADNVFARWHMSVQIPDGRECSDSGEDIYEPRYVDGTVKRLATFPAGPLASCLEVPDHQIIASWQVLLWGWLPLKPTFYFKPPRN